MGELSHCNVPLLVDTFHCLHFVETGTGLGAGIGYALTQPFKTLTTIEIEPKLYEAGTAFFNKRPDNRLFRALGKTSDLLPFIMQKIPPSEPVMFWLDAHFPGVDYDLHAPGDESRDEIRLPLETELLIIYSMRPRSRDVILIDDARIYIDGCCEKGDIPEEHRSFVPNLRDIEFVRNIYANTHTIDIDPADHGYIVVLPKPESDYGDVHQQHIRDVG